MKNIRITALLFLGMFILLKRVSGQSYIIAEWRGAQDKPYPVMIFHTMDSAIQFSDYYVGFTRVLSAEDFESLSSSILCSEVQDKDTTLAFPYEFKIVQGSETIVLQTRLYRKLVHICDEILRISKSYPNPNLVDFTINTILKQLLRSYMVSAHGKTISLN